MAMQYDVKSVHMQTSGVAVNYRTRLKGSIISANAAAAARNVVYANNSTQTGYLQYPRFYCVHGDDCQPRSGYRR